MADTKVKDFLCPEGRVINQSLFVKDIYTDEHGREGTPSYKIEMAFDPEDVLGDSNEKGFKTLEDACADAIEAMYGSDAANDFLDGKVKSPLLKGDRLAEKRERNGKQGDAYKGMIVIRAHTQFNKHGENGPGGVQVFDEDVNPIGPANQDAIYSGCYGQLAVTIKAYTNNDGDKTAALYLSAFQKTRDGERLFSSGDRSNLFKPVGRDRAAASGDAPAEGSTRRRRAG